MLNATPFVRRKMVEEVETLDDEIQSRFEKIHGADGLCYTLMELFNAMAELRMKVEYGDYLAYTCEALRGNNMNDMRWKLQKTDWQAVAKQINAEAKTKADQKSRRLPISPTPYLDDIAKAAARLGYDVDLVKYQILAYADRNNICHTGLKAMINHCDFGELAERIIEDLRSLEVIFQGKPQAQIEMRSIIKIVEREWFDAVWIDGSREEARRVKWVLSDKANQKLKKSIPKELS